jgi:dihydroorotase
VTCDTAPPYFALNELAVGDYRTFAKLSPPLRGEADRKACREGLADGTLDAIATDHAPHAVHEKDLEFTLAPPGMIGFETALAVVLELVREGELTPLELVRRLSTNPARILRRAAGSLAAGSPGDVAVVDPERRWTYDPAKGFSKSRNSPWAGQSLTGRVLLTFVGGKLVYDVERGVVAP